MHIGFIGLGHMGQPMAKNLLQHDYSLTVYDIVPEAVTALVKEGARAATQLSEVTKDADVIITMLQTGDQVKAVCQDDNGLFVTAKPNTLFIDCSSIDVSTTRYLQNTAYAKKLAMLDAPVSGGVAGAAAGTLTFMVGGEAADFKRAEPILNAMGKKIVHTGPGGTGQVAKICNNMVLGISMIAISEAFALGEKFGLAPEKLFEICANASGQCWALTSYCPVPGLVPTAPSNRDYQPGFTAKMMLKDLRLSQTIAASADQKTPLGHLATEIYALFAERLHNGDLDFSAIIRLMYAQIGLETV